MTAACDDIIPMGTFEGFLKITLKIVTYLFTNSSSVVEKIMSISPIDTYQVNENLCRHNIFTSFIKWSYKAICGTMNL